MTDISLWQETYYDKYTLFLSIYNISPIALYMKFIKTIRRYGSVTMRLLDINNGTTLDYFTFRLDDSKNKDGPCICICKTHNLNFDNIRKAWNYYQERMEEQLKQ